jgi:type I restriction enzyme M protein
VWTDNTELLKVDVVLTNPPFGEDRAYRVKTEADRRVIEMYETWHLIRQKVEGEDAFAAKHERGKKKPAATKGSEALDLGIVFLENAYHSIKDDGRFGIVLSNSIASINRWTRVRDWLMQRMRLVALFDLPANVLAETGVNTSLLIAYKPKPTALKRLTEQGYSIFVRDIRRVGYEKRTSKRNVFFNPVYQIDETTFDIRVDTEGRPVLDEEFTETLAEFRQWALGQEETLQRLFLKED